MKFIILILVFLSTLLTAQEIPLKQTQTLKTYNGGLAGEVQKVEPTSYQYQQIIAVKIVMMWSTELNNGKAELEINTLLQQGWTLYGQVSANPNTSPFLIMVKYRS